MLANPSMVMIKPEQAMDELARRELARRHLVDYSEYVAPWYKAARHHRLVGEILEEVEAYIRTSGRTGISRVLILEPPRHGKSEQASVLFPSWVMGKNPDSRTIITAYGLGLAGNFSKYCRNIVMSNRYQAVFGERATVDRPVEISSDSRSVQAWDLAAPNRGGLVAAGVGGGITGMGAHLLIVDDPFKNREEAESGTFRDNVWDWWQSTAYTRLEDHGVVVGMLTRWHGDDWAGRLLKAMANTPGADQWQVVCLMALWEKPATQDNLEEWRLQMMREGVWVDIEDPLGRQDGQALWPEKYNEEDLTHIKGNIGNYEWNALYQQTPYSRVGNLFQKAWFEIVDNFPKAEDVVARGRFWDKAGSKSGGGDYTAGVLMSITKDDVVYVEHLYFERGTPGKREEAILRIAKQDAERKGPRCMIWHQQDPGTSGLDSAQMTNMNLAKAGFTAHFELVTGDKETRAGSWSSACEALRVRLVKGAWNDGFIERHIGFPKVRFDDDVDAASWGFNILAKEVRMNPNKMVDFA